MGRKIPAKKHRGVKDPLVQQARRLEILKGKINAPPKDPDEQPVPRSLSRLFEFQNQNKKKNISSKKYNNKGFVNDKDKSVCSPAHNPISRLRKLPGETGRDFSLRINNAVKALHNPAEELDYPMDIEAQDVKGMRMAEQRERRARKRRKASKAAQTGGDDAEPHLTRTQKLALKKKVKMTKAFEADKERHEVVYERISFGDVTHAPPSLHFKCKANSSAPRPGSRQLLLSAMLGAGGGGVGGGGAGRVGGVGGAGAGEARHRELARADAVAAYRALKASRLKNK